ncbi:MAG: VOC family protein [Nitrososphaerales archaeon]
MDSVIHFEIPADNQRRAEDFYSKAFGWSVQPMPGFEYSMVGTTESNEMGMPKEPGRINGGMPKRGGPVQSIVVTVGVEDIDAALGRIEKLGGKTLQKKMPIGDMGFTAYFKDTEGNVVGLWQNSRPM